MKEYEDISHLASNQYADDEKIQLRKRFHSKYSTSASDFHTWTFEKLDLSGSDTVLDIGCGSGAVWLKNVSKLPQSARFVMGDISKGIMEALTATESISFDLTQCQAGQLPFEDAQFDVVTGFHMLYHVPDIALAIRELDRVMHNRGVLYLSTKGETHLKELYALLDDVLDDAPAYPKHHRFSLDNGATQLAEVFENVQRYEFHDSLLVTEAEPIVEFATSGMYFDPSEKETLRNRVKEKLSNGPIEIQKDTGLFVAQHD